MKHYAIKVRRWWAAPSALVVVMLVCWMAGTSEVPVPTLAGGMGSAQLAYFTPVLVIIAVVYCFERRLGDVEATAVVSVRWLDRGATVFVAVLAQGAGLVVGMDVARNAVLLLALALIVRRLTNEATAAGAALGFLIVNILLGRVYSPDGVASYSWWAVALYPSGSAAAWLFSVALFLCALVWGFPRSPVTR